jgi:hypothetical protein
VFENSLEREISNETVAMIVEIARRFALESSFQTRPKKWKIIKQPNFFIGNANASTHFAQQARLSPKKFGYFIFRHS